MAKIRNKRATLSLTLEARDSVNLLKGLNSVFSAVCEGAMCEGHKNESFSAGIANPNTKIRYQGHFKKQQGNLLYFDESLKFMERLNELAGQ